MLTGAPPALTSGSAWKDGRGGRAAHTSAAVCVAPGHTQRPGLLCPDAARRVAVVPLCTFHQAVVARQRAAGGNEVSGAGSINFTSVYAHTHTHTLVKSTERQASIPRLPRSPRRSLLITWTDCPRGCRGWVRFRPLSSRHSCALQKRQFPPSPCAGNRAKCPSGSP